MYRILLTDDESLIVDGLYEYLYARCSDAFDIVRAYSAKEALGVMERMRVDIAVTDIEMPVLNGISFYEIICRKWPRAKTIFLTAHSNFDYLYYSSHFSNTRFLLKSEGFEALLEAIRETAGELSMELFTHRGRPLGSADYNGQLAVAQMSMMRGLLTDAPRETTELQRRLDAWGVPLSAEKPLVPVLLRCENQTSGRAVLSLCAYFQEEFYPNSDLYPICLDEQSVFFLFQQNEKTTLLYPEFLREMMDLMLASTEKQLNSPALLVICAETIGWNQLGLLYEKMLKSALYYAGTADSVICMVNSQTLQERGPQEVHQNTLARIDKYLETHFGEDISLADIAAQVYLSASYTSAFYKKQKGVNVIDRLNQIRICKSEEMLRQTNLKIQDIAERCGFRSPRYFISVFRKVTGVNPGKYREEQSRL